MKGITFFRSILALCCKLEDGSSFSQHFPHPYSDFSIIKAGFNVSCNETKLHIILHVLCMIDTSLHL